MSQSMTQHLLNSRQGVSKNIPTEGSVLVGFTPKADDGLPAAGGMGWVRSARGHLAGSCRGGSSALCSLW